MNDKSNDHSINRLKKIVTPNIIFKFVLHKYEAENNEDYNLNVNEYDLYKKSMKVGDDDDKEGEVEFNCDDDMGYFLPYYFKATTSFNDKKDAFDLALCYYISNESVNGPTFDQFEHYQKIIKKNKVINNRTR